MKNALPTIIYRPMRPAEDGHPALGASLSTLGVRSGKDIPVADDGVVQPKSGGMSVTPDRWRDVPQPLLPRSLGGEGRHPLFCLEIEALPLDLVARVDRPRHANVEPVAVCQFDEFNAAVQATRCDWRPHE